MTDKQFARKLAHINSMLWDCINIAEDLLNTEQAKHIKSSLDDKSFEKLKELYSGYVKDCPVDCDLNNATLSDVSILCKRLYVED